MLLEMLAPVTMIIWWLNQTTESLRLEEEKPDVLHQASINTPPLSLIAILFFFQRLGAFHPIRLHWARSILLISLTHALLDFESKQKCAPTPQEGLRNASISALFMSLGCRF